MQDLADLGRIIEPYADLILKKFKYLQDLGADIPPLGLDKIVLVAAAAHKLAVHWINNLKQVTIQHLIRQLELFTSFLVLDKALAVPLPQINYFELVFKVLTIKFENV